MGGQLLLLCALVHILICISEAQKYWSCDPECPLRCGHADSKTLCCYIPDVTITAVTFETRCHFDCANMCYSQGLKVHNEGDCTAQGLISSESDESGEIDDDGNTLINPDEDDAFANTAPMNEKDEFDKAAETGDPESEKASEEKDPESENQNEPKRNVEAGDAFKTATGDANPSGNSDTFTASEMPPDETDDNISEKVEDSDAFESAREQVDPYYSKTEDSDTFVERQREQVDPYYKTENSDAFVERPREQVGRYYKTEDSDSSENTAELDDRLEKVELAPVDEFNAMPGPIIQPT